MIESVSLNFGLFLSNETFLRLFEKRDVGCSICRASLVDCTLLPVECSARDAWYPFQATLDMRLAKRKTLTHQRTATISNNDSKSRPDFI